MNTGCLWIGRVAGHPRSITARGRQSPPRFHRQQGRHLLGRPGHAWRLLRELRPGALLTVHGFRSSFRDWCAERTSYPNHVVELALAHQIGGDKVEKPPIGAAICSTRGGELMTN